MDTNTSTNDVRETLLAKWHEEHQQLETFTNELRHWAYEIGQLGIPRFGQTAGKLTQLRARLVAHFERENEIGSQLLSDQASPSVEVQATCRQSALDHANLIKRLDDLIARLNQNEPPFDSWEQAVSEIDLFMDAIEEHEEQETANITWLSPPGDDTSP